MCSVNGKGETHMKKLHILATTLIAGAMALAIPACSHEQRTQTTTPAATAPQEKTEQNQMEPVRGTETPERNPSEQPMEPASPGQGIHEQGPDQGQPNQQPMSPSSPSSPQTSPPAPRGGGSQ
jgi:hypothetical protein